jgi:nucleoside-diphosphate-sugar epimerase
MRAIDRGRPLSLGAITENRRTLIYVENLVSAILHAIDQPLPKLAGAAAGRRDSVMRLTESRTVVGWQPPLAMDEGLRRTAQWYRDGLLAVR